VHGRDVLAGSLQHQGAVYVEEQQQDVRTSYIRAAAQRLNAAPAASERQNAASRRAASVTSESCTVSTGECM
jgi:hypothetical protein